MRETLTPGLAEEARQQGGSARERGLDAVQRLLLGARHLAEAEQAAGRRRDHLREADDLVLEQPVLLVVELAGERLDVRLPRVEQLVGRLCS